MQQRFNQMSSSIIGRIDEMGNRIDDLEKSISDLMQQVRSGARRMYSCISHSFFIGLSVYSRLELIMYQMKNSKQV